MKAIVLVLMLLPFCSAYTQSVLNYNFAASVGIFTPISGGNTMPLSGGNTDDGWFNAIPVGFTFYYMGVPCTTVSASTKGWMTFGQNISNAAYNNLLQSGGTRPLVAPLWDDHNIQNAANFSYLTTGSAPSRIFTAQWSDVKWKNTATAGCITFQVRLHEANGKVEFIYHPEAGTPASPSASIGITAAGTGAGNFWSLNNASASPTASSTTETTTISTKPADGQVYTFSPPATSPAAPVNLTFTDITKTSITVNWTDNSTTESYFTASYSQDGVNWTSIGTVPSATMASTGTAYNIGLSGLLPGIVYQFRIVSNTEGNPPSSYLSGSQQTAPAVEITSITTGIWSATTTWSTGAVPTSLDNVTIANGHTVTIDADGECNRLTVGQGTSGILRFGTVARTITVVQDVSVTAGAVFDAGAASGSNLTHNLRIGGSSATAMGTGSLAVNGTFDMYIGSSNGKCIVTFFGIPDATISGAGTPDFYRVTLNKGATQASATVIPPVLEVLTTWSGSGNSATGFLYTHSAGTIKVGGNYTFTNNLYATATWSVPATGACWLNNPNFTMSAQSGNPTVNGLFRLSQGTCGIGSTANTNPGTGTGATFLIENGTLNVGGRIHATNAINWIQHNGIVNTTTVSNTGSNLAGFGLANSASTFTMSGGTIALQFPNTITTVASRIDFFNNAGVNTITGGTLQLGNANSGATAKTFIIKGTAPSVIMTNTSANHNGTMSGNLTIAGDLTLNGTGTFNTGIYSLSMTGMSPAVPGNITVNTGSNLTLNTSPASSLVFAGTFGNQALTVNGTITGSQAGRLTVNNTFAGGGTVTIPGGLTLLGDGALDLAAGTLACGSGITAGTGGTTGFSYSRGNGQLSGTLTRNFGSGTVNYTYNGTMAQTTGSELPASISGTLTIGNPAGVALGSALQAGKLTLTSGVLTTSATHLLTITGTNVTDITRTSGHVSGPLQLTLPPGLTGTVTYLFPTGKSIYNPVELVNPVTTATGPVAITAEVFDAASGGTPGASMFTLNANRYWNVSLTSGGGNFSGSLLRLTEEGLTGNSAIAQSPSKTGVYERVSAEAPSGNTLVTGYLSAMGFFVTGDKRMNYVSSTTTQANVSYVREGSSNQEILGIQVVTSGSIDPAILTSFTFSTTGSTRVADIASAKVFYTGTSPAFAATGQFGSAFTSPTGSFVINGSQPLAEGINYFWLVYDVAMGVIDNDLLDGECNSVTVRGSAYTPAIQAPAGNRTVRAALSGTVTVGTAGTYPTLTGTGGLFEKISLVGLKGNVTASIVSDITEPATNALSEWYEAGGSGFSFSVVPDASVMRTLSGSSNGGLIRLNKVNRVTFDGRISGAGKFLTIKNNAATGTIASLQLIGSSAGAGCRNITIRNCHVGTGHLGAGSNAIAAGGATPGNAGYDHDSLSIINCNIFKAYQGIYVAGNTAGRCDGLVISGDSVGSSITGSEISRYGIYLNNCNGALVSGNTVFNITSTTNELRGIYLVSGCINSRVTANLVTGIRTTAAYTNGSAGIAISPGSVSANITLDNNIITDIMATGSSNLGGSGIAGIRIDGGKKHYLYFNSVNLSGNTSHALSGDISAALYISAIDSVYLVNNILRNSIVNTAASATAYAIYVPMSRFGFTWIDYNDYFGTGSQGRLGYCDLGIASSIGEWRVITQEDLHSKSEDPLFSSMTDLHVDLTSPARQSALAMAQFPADFEGYVRHLTAPTMGALEQSSDVIGPAITYSAPGNTASLSARTLVATITDSTGVPTSGTGLPVLYWNINRGSWNSSTAIWLGGSQYQFTFGGGVTTNDSVFYFIAAQDTRPVPNVSCKPSQGAAGSSYNPPAYTVKPANPGSYRVVIGLSGVVTVGSGGNYLTLTGPGGLFETINNNLLMGNLRANIISDITEPGTVQLFKWKEEGTGNYVLSVRPDATTQRTISGNCATGLIVLNGARRVSINGGIGDTLSRYLLFRNTLASNPVFRFLNGAQYDTIRNCIIESMHSGVFFGTSTDYNGNSWNQVRYNLFRNRTDATGIPIYAIYSQGSSSYPNKQNTIHANEMVNFSSSGIYIHATGNGGEWIISCNSFYNNLSPAPSTAQKAIHFAAGWLSFSNQIRDNFIGGQAPMCGGNGWENSGTNDMTMIHFTAGSAGNVISGNKISNIVQSSSSAGYFTGILVTECWCSVSDNTIGDADQARTIRNAGSFPTIEGIRIYTPTTTCEADGNLILNLVSTSVNGTPTFNAIFAENCHIRNNRIAGVGHAVSSTTDPYITGLFLNTAYGALNEIYNNSVALDGGNSDAPEIYGIYDLAVSADTYEVYHNSVSIASPPGLKSSPTGRADNPSIFYNETAALYRYSDAEFIMKNNVLANFRTSADNGNNFCFDISDTAGMVSEYNDLFCNNDTLGTHDGNWFMNIASWRAYSGQDLLSISANPLYTDPNIDLLPLAGSPLAGAGTGLPEVPDDLNGLPRDPVTPTIGCYEMAAVYSKTWNGSISSSWGNGSNWTPMGVPGASDDVLIPSNVPYGCSISAAGKICRRMTLEPGAFLNLTAPGSITINGNLQVGAGATLDNNGVITLKGNLINQN